MRLFIAIELTSEIKENIISAQKELQDLDIKLVEPENLHFCLKFIGEADDEEINQIKTTLDQISQNKFQIELRGIGVFPSEDYIRAIWIGVSDDFSMKKLANIIDNSLSKLGFNPEKRSFKAHLTLGRVKSRENREQILKFITKYEDRSFGAMSVNSIKLISSELTPSGPVYKEIHKVDLLE